MTCAPAAESEHRGPVDLPISAQGVWQVIALPRALAKTVWPGSAADTLYVALLSPTPKDLQDDYSPCGPPARVVLLDVREGAPPREKLLHRGEYCASSWNPPPEVPWATGPSVTLEGISAALDSTGGIALTFRIRRDRGFAEDKATVPEVRRGEWQQHVSPAELRRIFPR
jgi:hypothetical protein